MKKLQNNFTTPEQSKRLLELGVPEWTADLRYRICKDNDSILGNPYLTKGKKYIGSHFNSSLPCWSVGRLIEIYEIVGENAGQCVSTTKSTSRIESLVQLYEENATLLDFSKLEE
jgi:hypothetical protein